MNVLSIKNGIEKILKMSGDFDKILQQIIAKTSENNIDKKNIIDLTTLYMEIRVVHGEVLLLFEKMKTNACNNNEQKLTKGKKEIRDTQITRNNLYDISTFTSIIENLNSLVSNTDFEFKKIALMYPSYINTQQNHIILLTNSKDDKYTKIFDELKHIKSEYEYHLIECKKGDDIDCTKNIGIQLKLNVKKIPSMFMVTNNDIIEIPLDSVKDTNDLVKLVD